MVRRANNQQGPEGFTTSPAFTMSATDKPARDVSRADIPTQLRDMNAALKRNLDRVAGLVRKGDYYKAAEVSRRFVVPLYGTAQALTDKLNSLEPGHHQAPLLSTHLAPKVKVAQKRYPRWSEK